MLPIWVNKRDLRYWFRDLDNALWTLDHQSVSPFEVIVVDSSPHDDSREKVRDIVLAHEARYIEAPMKDFHATRILNIGIKRAGGEYIACTGFEMMWSENYLEVVTEKLDKSVAFGSMCGFLAPTAHIPHADKIFDHWDTWVASMTRKKQPEHKDESWYRSSTGALELMHRDHWYHMRGYNEALTFAYVDSDLVRRIKMHGKISRVVVKFQDAQLIHPYHQMSVLVKRTRHQIGIMQNTQVVVNQERWGEL